MNNMSKTYSTLRTVARVFTSLDSALRSKLGVDIEFRLTETNDLIMEVSELVHGEGFNYKLNYGRVIYTFLPIEDPSSFVLGDLHVVIEKLCYSEGGGVGYEFVTNNSVAVDKNPNMYMEIMKSQEYCSEPCKILKEAYVKMSTKEQDIHICMSKIMDETYLVKATCESFHNEFYKYIQPTLRLNRLRMENEYYENKNLRLIVALKDLTVPLCYIDVVVDYTSTRKSHYKINVSGLGFNNLKPLIQDITGPIGEDESGWQGMFKALKSTIIDINFRFNRLDTSTKIEYLDYLDTLGE